MADVTTWEEDEVKCKVRLEGKKYKNAKTVEFVFQRKDDNSPLGSKPADVKSSFMSKSAETVWKASKTKDAELFYVAKYHLKIDGKDEPDVPQDIFVWAKDMTVAVKNGAGDAAFAGALVHFEQDVPAVVQKKLSTGGAGSLKVMRRSNDQGQVKFELQVPADVRTTIARPYEAVGDWTKPVGRKREVKAKLGLKARIEWPIADLVSGEHEQFVNLDTALDKPAHGPTMRVKIATLDTDPGQPGDTVFIKAKFADDNAARTARPGETAKGGEVKATVQLDAERKAVFELMLGPAGGDKVTISVGGTREANDATVVVRSWRKLFYQLKGPDFIASALPAKTMPDGTDGYDIAALSTAQIKTIMDKIYARYEVLKSYAHAADLYPDHQKVPSEYIGLPAGSTAFVCTVNQYNSDLPTAFETPDARTILIQTCNVASTTAVAVKTVEKAMTAAELTINVAADYKTYAFPKLPEDGSSALDMGASTWEADVEGLDPGTENAPGPDANHPAFDNFVARKGTMSATWVTFASQWRIKVTLPSGSATDPGSFAGAKGTASKCPIKIKFFLRVPATWVGGAAVGTRQLLQVLPNAPKIVGQVMCHELGHTMGMTIMAGGRKPPYGMAVPPDVDNGGNYYRSPNTGETAGAGGIRTGGQGSHCAEGIGDKTASTYAAAADSLCVMFHANSPTDDKSKDAYCATCIKHLKARNLKDISTAFTNRDDADC